MLKKSVHEDFAYTVSCYVPRGRSPAILYIISELRVKTFFEIEVMMPFSRNIHKSDRNVRMLPHNYLEV